MVFYKEKKFLLLKSHEPLGVNLCNLLKKSSIHTYLSLFLFCLEGVFFLSFQKQKNTVVFVFFAAFCNLLNLLSKKLFLNNPDMVQNIRFALVPSLIIFCKVLGIYHFCLQLEYFTSLFFYFQFYKLNYWVRYLGLLVLHVFFLQYELFSIVKRLKLFLHNSFFFFFCEGLMTYFFLDSNNNKSKFPSSFFFKAFFFKKFPFMTFKKKNFNTSFLEYCISLKKSSKLKGYFRKHLKRSITSKNYIANQEYTKWFQGHSSSMLFVKVTVSRNNFFLNATDFWGNSFFKLTKSFLNLNYYRKRSPLIVEELIDEFTAVIYTKYQLRRRHLTSNTAKLYSKRILIAIQQTNNRHPIYNLSYLRWFQYYYRKLLYKVILQYKSEHFFYRNANYFFTRFSRRMPVRGKLFKRLTPFNGCRLKKRRRL